MQKDTRRSLTTALALTCGAAISAHAQSADALLNKLVEKGVLTADEAKNLATESKSSSHLPEMTGMPSWVKSMKWSGDFRARYDGVYQQTDPVTNGQDRYRLRYRLRVGATINMSDNFEVGVRLGSGEVQAALGAAGSPFSANTTLDNNGTRKPIFVDLAYAKWKPKDWFQAEFGKMTDPFWMTDMVLDPDYNPEGAQQRLTYELNENHKISLTTGAYVVDEVFSGGGTAGNNDAYLFIGQIDWTGKWSDRLSSHLAVGGYSFKNQRDITFDTPAAPIAGQKGLAATGAGAQNFNPVVARGEVTYTLDSFPMFNGAFPISLGGEYVNNPGATAFKNNNGNQAYNLGASFGSAKKTHNWMLSYNYKEIGTAAVWHGINDDDYGFGAAGGTDIRGHQVSATYHLLDPLSLGLRYFRTEQINNLPGFKSEQDRLFFDLVWAF